MPKKKKRKKVDLRPLYDGSGVGDRNGNRWVTREEAASMFEAETGVCLVPPDDFPHTGTDDLAGVAPARTGTDRRGSDAFLEAQQARREARRQRRRSLPPAILNTVAWCLREQRPRSRPRLTRERREPIETLRGYLRDADDLWKRETWDSGLDQERWGDGMELLENELASWQQSLAAQGDPEGHSYPHHDDLARDLRDRAHLTLRQIALLRIYYGFLSASHKAETLNREEYFPLTAVVEATRTRLRRSR